jgi:hypothetical protein
MLAFLVACATINYTERTMRDPTPGSAPGEFYVVISERACTSDGVNPPNCDDKARLLRCQESRPGSTSCHTALTSDQAFAAAARDAGDTGAVTCAAVIAAVKRGDDEAALLTMIRGAAIRSDEVECINSQGLPPSVQAAVEQAARAR